MNNLLIITPEMPRVPHDEQRRREDADESPRTTYFDDAVATRVIDQLYLQGLKGWRALIYRRLPAPVVAALEAFRLRRRYDAVINYDDRAALTFAMLKLLTRAKIPHVVLLHPVGPWKKRLALWLAQRGMDRIIVWSEIYRDLLIAYYGIAPARVVFIPFRVDEQFWRPLERPTEWICAVGKSKRDYATLIRALRDLPLFCRIVAPVGKEMLTTIDWRVTAQSLASAEVGENILLGPASPGELREIYARARFVVLPLPRSFHDHGVTVACEAMAMGKAIICTRTYGMIDLIEHGVNGLLVPPGDPDALRAAIQHLWEHPEVAERMGAEGRRRAERIYALERFTADVQRIVSEAAHGSASPPSPRKSDGEALERAPALPLPSPTQESARATA